jgi:hypothetical protein
LAFSTVIIWIIASLGVIVCFKIIAGFFKMISSIDTMQIDSVKEYDDAFVQMPDGTVRYDEGSLQ